MHLTFDDGPHPEHTPWVLDALAAVGAKATFFLIGREAEKYPELVQRMAAEGHTVGDHTWAHSDIRTLRPQTFAEELRRSNELLTELTGQARRLFRPPYGKVGPRQFYTLLRQGYTIALWNVDPRDYRCKSEQEVMSRLANWAIRSGDIVLLHDCMSHAAKSLEAIVRRVQGESPHFSFKAL